MFDLGIPVSERIVSILQPGDVWLWMVMEISPIMCVYIYMGYMTNNWVYMGCVCVYQLLGFNRLVSEGKSAGNHVLLPANIKVSCRLSLTCSRYLNLNLARSE